jgi:hypothetical protein
MIRNHQVGQSKTLIGKDGGITLESNSFHAVAGIRIAKRSVICQGQKPLAETLAEPASKAFTANT